MSSLIRSPVSSLVSDAHFYISGNVTIHPSAVIAPGVMLQADPGSELIVSAGVCIGLGCVLHAHQGVLELDAGATLGSSVLIVGQGKIGANACIGSMTTIIDSSVLPQQMIPPGSLLGDGSRQIVVVEDVVEDVDPSVVSSPVPPSNPGSVRSPQSPPAASPAPPKTEASPESSEVRVIYGQSYLERMMVTMFPHRRAIQEEQG